MPHLKIHSFTIHASKEQAQRWARVARYLRCKSVSSWLEELADEQAKRLDQFTRDGASKCE
jgi:hypothetical protein